jgi:hypothetical protein
MGMPVVVMASVLMLSSCNKDEQNIQQDYPFEVNVMPVPGRYSKRTNR